LQRRIWPADTFVDFDQGLNNAVKRLREALGDDAEKPQFIETLSKRGYRFIGSVENGLRAAAMPAAVAAVDSIVVLPFISLNLDPEDDFFADGVTEEIINALAQIEQLHVVARSSAFSFKGKHIDPRIIGEQLQVRTVLEGSVRRSGHHLRITVQLVNAVDGYHLWSERYDRETKDIFEIQDEIARSIAHRLKIIVEGGGQQRLVKASTSNLEAYELYLKGRHLLSKKGSAIYGLARPKACMPKGMEAARRAIALDPSLAETHTCLAMACLMGTWDKAEAELEFLRALELNPKYMQARVWYALFFLQFSEGRLEEGVVQAGLALQSDPLSAYFNCVFGFICSIAGRYDEGLQACERAVGLDSDSFIAHWCHHMALYLSGRFEEAAASAELALAISGRHPWAMGTLAATFAEWGKPSDAEAIYAELMGRARRSYVPPSILATTASAAGQLDDSLRHAREAFEIRDPISQFYLSKLTPAGARLLADPRFHEIPADMGWLLK